MDSLGSLRTFVQVAEMRSFADAARASGVSAAAIGKSIGRLEDTLAARLFHRSTRSVTLTAEGQMLLVRARRILAEAEAAQEELAEHSGQARGRLKVSLPVVSGLVLPVLSDFMRAHPDITLELDFSDRLVDVIDEGFDAVLRVGAPSDSRLSARRIGDFRRLLVASPSYLRQRGVPELPRDLAGHHCLHYRFPSTGRIEAWPLRDLPTGFQIPQTMICNDTETRAFFALRDQGITYLPDHVVRLALAQGTLVSVLDEHLDASGDTFHLLWPSGRHVMPKLRVFIDFISERLLSRRPSTVG